MIGFEIVKLRKIIRIWKFNLFQDCLNAADDSNIT